jgi:erythromycin esterase
LAQEIEHYVRSNLSSIHSIDPENTDYIDLIVIGEAIGSSRIVFLGEQDHGDAPCFMAKTRIIKYLHEVHGFDVLVFESDFYGLNRAWEEKDQLSPEKLFANIYPIWTKCEQNKALFDYIGNKLDSGNPVILAGIDVRHRLSYSRENYLREFDEMLTSNGFGFSWNIRFKNILEELLLNEYQSQSESADRKFFFE